jgi:GntR family transcriptional regulator
MKKIKLNNTQIPLHYQIADYLVDMLRRGDILPDAQVPPEEELASVFGVSRATIRRSLEHLLDRELLTRKQGKGTFWKSSAKNLLREKLAGLNKKIFHVNGKTTVRVLSKTIVTGSPEVCRFLNAPDGTEFVMFRRVRYVGGEPMSYTINYLQKRYGAEVHKQHLQKMTMLEALEKILKIELGVVEHEVEVTRATAEIANQLGLRVLEPVLTVKTSIFDKRCAPVEIVWTHFVENKYKFRVVLE